MLNIKSALAVLVLVLQVTKAFGAQAVLSDDYLLGKWSTGEIDDCTSDQVTYVLFRDTHTLEAGKGKSVDTVGFWHIANDRVIAHLLVSPSPGRESHPFFQDKYHYQYRAPKVLEVQPDRVVYTHDADIPQGNRMALTRCK